MRLYLMRHAEAEAGLADRERPLTPAGARAAGLVAARLGALGLQPAAIVHSDLRRARETAEIIARELAVAGVEERPWLRPHSRIEPAAAWLEGRDGGAERDDAMLVSHLPFLERLLVHLAGRAAAVGAEFALAAVVCLEGGPVPGAFRLDRLVLPT